MPNPEPLEFFYNALAVPPHERELPIQRVLGSGHLVEIRSDQGRHYLCGLPHEMPLAPDDSVIESLLEDSFSSSAIGFLAYEPSSQRLIFWSEILPADEPGGAPKPDLSSFLRELSDLSKKLSLAGAI